MSAGVPHDTLTERAQRWLRRPVYRNRSTQEEELRGLMYELVAELARVSSEHETMRAEVDRQLGRHLCYTSPDARDRFWQAVAAALAAGSRVEEQFTPEGDERCGEPMDACLCMKRKGHDGSHACPHGFWAGSRVEDNQ